MERGQLMNTTTTTPNIGMSVSYCIGSDSYHEIIVKTEKNARTILTARADELLFFAGAELDKWNALTEEAREFETIKAFNKLMEESLAYEMSWRDTTLEDATRISFARATNKYTKRNDGSYLTAGKNFGAIILNSQRRYMAPEF